VFNHCSTYVADVVWTGLSTQHIRQGIESDIDLETLRDCWMAISPVNYMSKFAAHPKKKSKFIYTTYGHDVFFAGVIGGYDRAPCGRPRDRPSGGGAAVRPLHDWGRRRSSFWTGIIFARF